MPGRAQNSPPRGDADLAATAALMGDPTRASILLALLGGPPLAAGELAARARVSPSLASAHLAKLRGGGLVVDERLGRRRLYRLASPAVASAVEMLLTISPPAAPRTLRQSEIGSALRKGRTCYDHLAGALGVELADALHRTRWVAADTEGFRLTAKGERELTAFGIDVAALETRKRPLTRGCLDWSERRPHLAGAVGAALARRCFELGWVNRLPSSRAVAVTPAGHHGLAEAFGVRLAT